MKKDNFLVIPDSFKGSITAKRACEIIESAIKGVFPSANVVCYPAFDGGEGSAEYMTAIYDGKTVGGKVQDGNFFIKDATYGVSGEKAFIAVANSSGLPDTMIKDPAFTTTYGFGQQINQAIKLGKKEIIVALGGSSTNDGGAGAACALGAEFFDKEGKTFVPTGGTLEKIDKINVQPLLDKVQGRKFVALCDVSNPLVGEKGCSYVFAKQKGAKTREMQDELERNMLSFAEKTAFLGVDKMEQANGSAGGLGYFVKAFLKGEVVSGSEWFLRAIDFVNKAKTADVIICGEGRFDDTDKNGKICGKIIETVKNDKKPVVVFCGENIAKEYDKETADFVTVLEINDKNLSIEDNIKQSEYNLLKTATNYVNELKKSY